MQRVAFVLALAVMAALVFFGRPRYLAPLCVIGSAMAGVVTHLQTRLALDLPLCPPCDERWRNGLTARNVGLVGIFAGALALSFGQLLGVGLFVGSIAFVALTKLAKRVIGGWFMPDGSRILLFGLAPAAAQAISEQQHAAGQSHDAAARQASDNGA